jgi:hypothetical protein
MRYDEARSLYVLSTGTEIDAQALFDPTEQIRAEEDGTFYVYAQQDMGINIGMLTPAERAEIANYMVESWLEWGSLTI